MADNKGFGIYFDEKDMSFLIQTEKASYVMAVVNGYLGHVYFGKKLGSAPGLSSLRMSDYTYLAGKPGDKCTFMDGFPFEYSISGTGDFRACPLVVKNNDGFYGGELKYSSHSIYKGKRNLPGLPATFGSDEHTWSLDITLTDDVLGLKVVLTYSIFEGIDAVTRSVRVELADGADAQAADVNDAQAADVNDAQAAGVNDTQAAGVNDAQAADVNDAQAAGGNAVGDNDKKIYIEKIMSASLEMPCDDKEIITLHGSWARERIPDRRVIGHGTTSVSSSRGISSHQEHPFAAFVSPDCTEEHGEVLAMSFVYSGNFLAEAERTQHDMLRINMGINPQNFSWELKAGESFTAPEVIMVYSAEGLGAMTESFHEVIRKHLIRSKYLHKKRPVLLNNWEATYFDFNEEKLLKLAETAKKAGIEMLVMDDGWFGKRDSDNCSLGDWKVDRRKLPNGVGGLCKKINDIGLEMGIWFEPEMISPDSDLFRAHPDYAIQIPGRNPSECRNQFVLDITRKEVRDCIFEQISDILKEANIRYIKWDMNRPLTDVGSITTRGGEFHHRYMLAVYELQERLISEYPDLLLENCTSGGGRFDPGMMYFSPQIWCSDDTDAIERLAIQEGTALIYPLSVIGAHVSICPNHIVGRTTDLKTRGYVALAGTFGYEMDINRLSENELAEIAGQIEMYHKYNDLVREGDYYRLISSNRLVKRNSDNTSYSWMVVSKDGSEALMTYVQARGNANTRPEKVKLKGLCPNTVYELSDGRSYRGDELMNIGFITDKIYGDGAASLYYFRRKEDEL